MQRPADRYIPSSKPYFGLPDLHYPLHDREYLVTACGRICMHRKKINISTVLAGQKLGLKEVDDGIWLISFMHDDLASVDLEQKTLQPIDNPFGTRVSPMSWEHSVTHVSGLDRSEVADGVGFEPTNPRGLAVFKTAALNRSATHPSLHPMQPGRPATSGCPGQVI